MQLLQLLVGGVAHIDAENIRTGEEQLFDHFGTGGGRPESGDDLDVAIASHWLVLRSAPVGGRVFSPDSEIVQSVSSLVSTSKKPVF